MSIASKISIGLFAASVFAVGAGEIAAIKTAADLTTPKAVTVADGVFTSKGAYKALFSKQAITVDPAKKYQISGEFRTKAGTKPSVYFGFAPYNAKGQPITCASICVTPDTATEVAADAPKGSKSILVKDASKWKTASPYALIVFNAKGDFSDLPNYSYISIVKNGRAQEGEFWKLTLKTPLKADVKAGTKVRQHSMGSAYIYTGGGFLLPEKWVARKGTISGMAKNTNPVNKFWPGTKTVRILILLMGGKADTEVEFKNIKVEEIQ